MVWCMQLSWRKNVDTWFIRSLFVVKTMWFSIPNFCYPEEEWVVHGVEEREVHDSNDA